MKTYACYRFLNSFDAFEPAEMARTMLPIQIALQFAPCAGISEPPVEMGHVTRSPGSLLARLIRLPQGE